MKRKSKKMRHKRRVKRSVKRKSVRGKRAKRIKPRKRAHKRKSRKIKRKKVEKRRVPKLITKHTKQKMAQRSLLRTVIYTPKPPSKISQKILNGIINRLIRLGERNKYITYEQLNDILPLEILQSQRLGEIIFLLEEKKVEVTSSDNTRRTVLLEREMSARRRKDVSTSGGKSGIEEYAVGVKMDDPVRTYLRQMGQIPLLTRDQEIALAKRIEDAENHLRMEIYEAKSARNEVLEVANQIVNDEISLFRMSRVSGFAF